jgi:site-specific DNA recombinase
VPPGETSPKTPIRCAIYTRKSTEEGLEQDFNSLDAQRECAEAYILSQRQEGWTLVSQRYDDGGFTGANLERPALRQLTADIEARRVDCVLVYKVDRLSRSLLGLCPADGGFRQARGDVCIGHSTDKQS